MIRLPVCALLLLSILVTTMSCGQFYLGDAGRPQDAIIYNETDVPVTVYGVSERYPKSPDARLQPGEQKKTGWLIPRGVTKQRTIEAYDDSGDLVFCKKYTLTYEDAGKEVLMISIVKGEISCD